ncbi:MAG TPA: DUF4388 domain-containing protein [Anaerolineales bacterium]|jgi:hypothetical protein|nr:DUF4388 domain-containing protein [Anaerolineales bacterium]
MALKGNLRDFTIAQLLNLINLAHKSGKLVVEGPDETAQVYFREGKLAYAQVGLEDTGLATILYQAKKLAANQRRIIQERAGNISDKELGLLLINANYITRQDVLNCLQNHSVSIVNRLFTWEQGAFLFENEALPPNDKIAVRLDLENLIIEGSRRMHEWDQLQDEIPSLDMALKFADRPGTNIRKVNLSVEEWRVVSYINPKNTMRQIARATKMNDLQIRRTAYALLQAGLVEIVRPEGAPRPAPKPAGLPVSTIAGSKKERKSLVNRIITRIRSL